jgi:hypothetical protein
MIILILSRMKLKIIKFTIIKYLENIKNQVLMMFRMVINQELIQ